VITDVLRPVVNVFSVVDDLEAATAWYTARLGVPPAVTAEQLVVFEVGAARLTLHRIDGFNAGGPGGQVAYWDVDDVDALVADWTAHGAVAHRGPKTIFTGERLCQVLDPSAISSGCGSRHRSRRRGSRHLGRRPRRGRGHLA
jgi:catechol 2,3-dioxygenase-like lactoylglutathione lyase family enzyme